MCVRRALTPLRNVNQMNACFQTNWQWCQTAQAVAHVVATGIKTLVQVKTFLEYGLLHGFTTLHTLVPTSRWVAAQGIETLR